MARRVGGSLSWSQFATHSTMLVRRDVWLAGRQQHDGTGDHVSTVLESYLQDRWQTPDGAGDELVDATTGEVVALSLIHI